MRSPGTQKRRPKDPFRGSERENDDRIELSERPDVENDDRIEPSERPDVEIDDRIEPSERRNVEDDGSDEGEYILYPIWRSARSDRSSGPTNRWNPDVGMGTLSCGFWNDSSMDMGWNRPPFQADPTDQTHIEQGGARRTLIASGVP